MLPKSKYNQYTYHKQEFMNLKNIYRNRYDKPPVNAKIRRKYLRSRDSPATSKTLSYTLLRNNDLIQSKGDADIHKADSNIRVKYESQTRIDVNNNSLRTNQNNEYVIFDELKKITMQIQWVKDVYKNLKYNKNKIQKIFLQSKEEQIGNIYNCGLQKVRHKPVKRYSIKLLDHKILKNQKILRKLLEKSSKEQIPNTKLLETLLKIANQTLLTPITIEIKMLRKENYFLKKDFDEKLSVFGDMIEHMQSIQNEYINLILSKTLPKTTSTTNTFGVDNSDIKDNIDNVIMNDVKKYNMENNSKIHLQHRQSMSSFNDLIIETNRNSKNASISKCKVNLKTSDINISSSLSLGTSGNSELKLSSPSKTSHFSSRDSTKSYSISSSKLEHSFSNKSPERLKSKSVFLRLMCCTNN